MGVGATSAWPKRRISVRIASMSSSRPLSPTVAPEPSRISRTRAARLPAVLPSAIRVSTASERWRATSWALRPSDEVGRTISPWLIGMPPKSCSRYSPSPMRTRSVSVSPRRPSPARRAA